MNQAYEAFIDQVTAELAKDGVEGEALDAAVFAMQKAKLLFTGSPVGTVLRHTKDAPPGLGATATRAINAKGIPLWQVACPDGSKYDTHEPILEPENDWTCIYNPEASA